MEEYFSQGKNFTKWFSSHHSQESLIKNQAVISIRNLTATLNYLKIPTYSWTFTPISNWTWSYKDFFLCTDLSTWLTSKNWCLFLDAKLFTFNTCKVVVFNYDLCWFYSMIKSVVIALILFIIFCGILLYWIYY